MKKKVLSLVLALLMAASSASAVLADEAIVDEAIADVEETAVVEEVAEAGQYDKAIAFLANYGIFKGISADDLGADLDVERYQMALFVARVSTGWVEDEKWEDGPENWSEFTDISEGPVANYWGALSYVNAKGIIEGYGNGKFGPTDGITYQNALTMTVRTLGYTGLEWPWGYIEKAVSLGLTDGITDVAYTDELTRGEVAQIIYNAMFAKTKDGSTLAIDNFGGAFGWEKIVVTASDLNTFVPDTKDAKAALKDETIAIYEKSNKPASGIVSFQILNDDGTLADDVYYVAKEALGLVGDHDDELAVGDAYYVLFQQNADDEFVDVVAYESLLVDTLVNAGKTDDDKNEVEEYAIEAWLADHALVSKYSNSAYINMTKSTKPEAIVFAANNEIEIVTGSEYAIAIDWATGDILVPVDTNEDGNWKDEWKAAKDASKNKTEKEIAETIKYTLKYSWNGTLKKYYEVVFDRDIDKFEDVAINWISEAEMEKLLKDYTYEDTKFVSGFNKAVDSLTKSAYATLKLFDTNLDGDADRAVYETYRLGYFENKQHKTCDCGKLDQYVFTDVDVLKQAIAASEIKNGEGKSDVVPAAWDVIEEGIKCKHETERGWIVDDSLLTLAVDEDGEETGYYAPAYVIYNYDKETGAIKIVKNITDGTDEDSFVATGIVRAFNVNKGTITIGEETYDINGYNDGWNTLLGNGFKYAADKYLQKAVYSALLRSLFNQFVEFVVVDGELVNIKALNGASTEVIVVDSYAGISSDGYFVVNGYSTADLKYDQFKIGSFDGWQQGDYFYYPNEEAFIKGTVYTIKSCDKGDLEDDRDDIYYVNIAGRYDSNDREYVTSDDVTFIRTKLEATEKNYLEKSTDYSKKDAKYATTKEVKMSTGDKYIVVLGNVENYYYAPIFVFEGKLPVGAVIEGENLKDTNVFVNATVTGLTVSGYKAGAVILLEDTYFKAAYDGVDAEDWYLLGAAEYEVAAFDFYTGKEVTVFATNKKLETGLVYPTQGDVITSDEGYSIYDAASLLKFNYDVDAKILEGKLADVLSVANLFKSKESANKIALETIIAGDYAKEEKFEDITAKKEKIRGEYVDAIVYNIVEFEDGKVVDIETIEANDAGDVFSKYAAKKNLTVVPGAYVYNYDAETAVVYIFVDEATETKKTADKSTDAVKVLDKAVYDVNAEVTYDVTETTVGGTTTKIYDVKAIDLAIVLDGEITHDNIYAEGAYFAVSTGNYETSYVIVDKEGGMTDSIKVLGTVTKKTFKCEQLNGEDCDLVQSVTVELDEARRVKPGEKFTFVLTVGEQVVEVVVTNDATKGIQVSK